MNSSRLYGEKKEANGAAYPSRSEGRNRPFLIRAPLPRKKKGERKTRPIPRPVSFDQCVAGEGGPPCLSRPGNRGGGKREKEKQRHHCNRRRRGKKIGPFPVIPSDIGAGERKKRVSRLRRGGGEKPVFAKKRGGTGLEAPGSSPKKVL